MKACTKCKEVKPLGEFYKRNDSEDGHRKSCKKCHRNHRIVNYHQNPIKSLEGNRKWRKENEDRMREYNRRYRELRHEELREYYRSWRISNPEKRRHYSAKRRAAKRGTAVNPFTYDDVVQIWGENPTCVYCQKNPAEHKDHFVPLARGGEHSLANATWPACAPCNLRKSDRHPFEFIATELMNDQQRKEFAEALMRRTNADRTYREEAER